MVQKLSDYLCMQVYDRDNQTISCAWLSLQIVVCDMESGFHLLWHGNQHSYFLNGKLYSYSRMYRLSSILAAIGNMPENYPLLDDMTNKSLDIIMAGEFTYLSWKADSFLFSMPLFFTLSVLQLKGTKQKGFTGCYQNLLAR